MEFSCFVAHFLFSRYIALSFQSCLFDVFVVYHYVFLFNHPISFKFSQILDTADWEQPLSFATLHYGLLS